MGEKWAENGQKMGRKWATINLSNTVRKNSCGGKTKIK